MIEAIMSLLVCLFFDIRLKRISKGGFLNLFYSFFYTLELGIALLLVFSDSDYQLFNGLYLSKALPIFGFACIIACLGIYLGQFLANIFWGKGLRIDLNERIDILSQKYSLNTVSLFFLVCFSFTIFSSLDIAYYIAVLALSFSFSSAFIGLIWRKLSTLNKGLWISALGINCIFHAVQGSRGTALFPIIFLILGYLISIKSNKKLFKKRVIFFSICALALFPFLSFISDFRGMQGRGLEVNANNIEMLWKIGTTYESKNNDDRMKSSLGRLLVEANPATIYMTPKLVAYRNDYAMGDEIKSIFTLAGESGRNTYREQRGNASYGTGVATRYGFPVNAFTSVEWPVFADGYSRFGFIGLFFYSMLFATFLSFLEKFISKMWHTNQLLSMILLLFILYNGVLSYMYSYYDFMKLLLFRMTLVCGVTYGISVLTKRRTLKKVY